MKPPSGEPLDLFQCLGNGHRLVIITLWLLFFVKNLEFHGGGFVVVKVLKLEEGSVSIGKDWLIVGGEGDGT